MSNTLEEARLAKPIKSTVEIRSDEIRDVETALIWALEAFRKEAEYHAARHTSPTVNYPPIVAELEEAGNILRKWNARRVPVVDS